jgi:hypothetical protein
VGAADPEQSHEDDRIRLRAAILELLHPVMAAARAAAGELVAEGRIDVTRRGEVVDLKTARGPIRLRLHRD